MMIIRLTIALTMIVIVVVTLIIVAKVRLFINHNKTQDE